MKKISLLLLVAMLLFMGNIRAQEEVVLLEEDFSAYTVGNKLSLESNAAGNDRWTTWANKPGSAEDGLVAEYGGNKCAYFTYGNDQVLKLGGRTSGTYEIEFDVLTPAGKNGYFNFLHEFYGYSSEYALESYVHLQSTTKETPGSGIIAAGGQDVTFVCIYDEWMHFRLHVDIDADLAQFYYTLPGKEEELIIEWQWSLKANGDGKTSVSRKLDAMSFCPTFTQETSEFYFDNFTLTRIGSETYPKLTFNPEAIEEEIPADEMSSVTINIKNSGTSVGEYFAWVDYGAGQGGNEEQTISYAIDSITEPDGLLWLSDEPVKHEIAALFPSSTYGDLAMGTYITGAACALFEMVDQQGNSWQGLEPGTDLTFRVYGPGTNGKPGEVLAEKVISQSEIVWNQYTVVEFDEPVALTGFDVYVAVELTAAVFSIVYNIDGSQQAVIGYGDLCREGNTAFFSITENGSGNNYGNWCLSMICEGTPVESGYATINNPNGFLTIGGSNKVKVNLNTTGLTPNETYEVAVKFVTNDPDQPTVNIPLTLKVGGESINENLVEKYNVCPNPTTGLVTIEGENIDYIVIYNSVGQLVNLAKNVNNTVDMSAYENGVYFFNIVDKAGQSALQQVVVAK